jgi:hypothetical protein
MVQEFLYWWLNLAKPWWGLVGARVNEDSENSEPCPTLSEPCSAEPPTWVPSADPPQKGGKLGCPPPAFLSDADTAFLGDVWELNSVAHMISRVILCVFLHKLSPYFDATKFMRRCLLDIKKLYLLVLKKSRTFWNLGTIVVPNAIGPLLRIDNSVTYILLF